MQDIRLDKQHLLELYKLKNIIRYNHRTRITSETVAEHSFFTALIALEVCNRLECSNAVIGEVITKALLHDMPETELNDITYDVKCRLNLYPLLKQYEDDYFKKHFPEQADLMIDNDTHLVNLIVLYADAMSVLQYAYNELELGNKSMQSILEDTIDRLSKLEVQIAELKK